LHDVFLRFGLDYLDSEYTPYTNYIQEILATMRFTLRSRSALRVSVDRDHLTGMERACIRCKKHRERRDVGWINEALDGLVGKCCSLFRLDRGRWL